MNSFNWNMYKSIIDWYKSYCFTVTSLHNYSEVKTLIERTRCRYSNWLYKQYLCGMISIDLYNHFDSLLIQLVEEF